MKGDAENYEQAYKAVILIEGTFHNGRQALGTAIWQDTDGNILNTLDEVLNAHIEGRLSYERYQSKTNQNRSHPL